MSNYDELKRLALAAPKGPWYGPDTTAHKGTVFDCDLGSLLCYESIETEEDACVAYVAAANPAAVLALIAENERLEYAVKLRNDNLTMLRGDAESKDQRIKNHFETIDSLADERDQLKAENEALRKSFAECIESLQGEMLQKFSGQLPEDMHPVTRRDYDRDYDRDMAEIAGYRAAMGNGEQP